MASDAHLSGSSEAPHAGFVPRKADVVLSDDPLFQRTTARTMAVLSAFHEADEPMSLSGIARTAGLDRSTTQRIVHTLRKLGYLRRDAQDRGYLPGIRLYDHIFDAMRLDPLIPRAVPLLLALRSRVGERVDLSLLDDTRLVYATRLQSKREVLHALLVGVSVPVSCTSSGWAVMSHMPERTGRDLLSRCVQSPFTPATLTNPDDIMANVKAARSAGFAIAQEQLLQGEIAIAAAVIDRSGQPIAAVTVTGLLSDWTSQDFAHAVAPPLMQTARILSRF